MNPERIEQWVSMQLRSVEPDGAACAWIDVVGPDDERVARFPRDHESIAAEVVLVLGWQRAELPVGHHRFVLRSETATGQQLSTLPQTLKGESAAAKSAVNEAKELQRATALALQNIETVGEGLVAENRRLQDFSAQLLEQNVALITGFRDVMAGAMEAQYDKEEHEARMREIASLASEVRPLLEIGMGLIAERIGNALGGKGNAKPDDSPSPASDRQSASASDDDGSGGAGDSVSSTAGRSKQTDAPRRREAKPRVGRKGK